MIEEQRKIKSLANDFDALLIQPGWDKVTQLMADKVNSAVIEATKTEMVSDLIRWNSMRKMLDDVESYIETTRRERDRLEQMEREEPQPEEDSDWMRW